MTLTFGLKRSSTKSKRTHKKFPRYKFKDFTAIPRNLKEWGYCKHNWNDDDYTYLNGDIEKFLKCHIGHSVNKVFSKFLSRCNNLSKFNPKEEFYSFIQNKEDISSQRGGFYITNGILNYKKPVKRSNYQVINKYNENQKRFNKLYLRPLIKALIELRVPQCIGKYLLREGEKTIYIDFYPGVGYYKNIWNKRQITNIIGVGRGINYDVINTQEGKTKYLYSVDTKWFSNRPDICFYFKK